MEKTSTEMKEFIKSVREDINTPLINLNVLKVDNLFYGFAVTHWLWYKARLYVGFYLPTDTDTVLRTIQEIRKLTNPSILYLDSSNHLSESTAFKKIDEFEQKALKGDYTRNLPPNLNVLKEFIDLEKSWVFHVNLSDFIPDGYSPQPIIGPEESKLSHSHLSHKIIEQVAPSYIGNVVDSLTIRGYSQSFEFMGSSFKLELHFLLYYAYEWQEDMKDIPTQKRYGNRCETKREEKYSLVKFFVLFGTSVNNAEVPLMCTSCFANVENTLRAFFQKNLKKAIGEKAFFRHFVSVIDHNQEDWKFMDPGQLCQTFEPGSVLLVTRRANYGLYAHAGVYLGCDLVIHITGKDEPTGRIFQFTQFSEYVEKEDVSIREFRFRLKPFGKSEIYHKAIQMNQESYIYNLKSNNCEHLAFELAIGIKTCTQTKSMIGSIMATILANFIGKC